MNLRLFLFVSFLTSQLIYAQSTLEGARSEKKEVVFKCSCEFKINRATGDYKFFTLENQEFTDPYQGNICPVCNIECEKASLRGANYERLKNEVTGFCMSEVDKPSHREEREITLSTVGQENGTTKVINCSSRKSHYRCKKGSKQATIKDFK